jgi:hypothetical protein
MSARPGMTEADVRRALYGEAAFAEPSYRRGECPEHGTVALDRGRCGTCGGDVVVVGSLAAVADRLRAAALDQAQTRRSSRTARAPRSWPSSSASARPGASTAAGGGGRPHEAALRGLRPLRGLPAARHLREVAFDAFAQAERRRLAPAAVRALRDMLAEHGCSKPACACETARRVVEKRRRA